MVFSYHTDADCYRLSGGLFRVSCDGWGFEQEGRTAGGLSFFFLNFIFLPNTLKSTFKSSLKVSVLLDCGAHIQTIMHLTS